MVKAVSYMRCSSIGAVEGDTWPRQRLAIQKYANANQIEIVEEFRDEGVSGRTELQNRSGLANCLARLEANGIRLVLIESADRLARDSLVAEIIIREFQKVDCRVVATSGGVDLTAGDDSNPTAKLVRQILAAIAEFDRCVIVNKLRAARERQRATGQRCEGRQPFGSKPGEDATLRLILGMRAKQCTAEEIARSLNQIENYSRSGKLWHPSTVGKILARHSNRQVTCVPPAPGNTVSTG